MKMLTPNRCAAVMLEGTPKLPTFSEKKIRGLIETQEPLVTMLHPQVKEEYCNKVLQYLNHNMSLSA